MIANISPVLGEMIKHAGEAIQTEMYENPESSVETCTVAFELFVKQAREGLPRSASADTLLPRPSPFCLTTCSTCV
jgi:hypothetical protein